MNSSRSSSKKSLKAAPIRVKKEIKLEIKAQNINLIGQKEVNKFKGLFIRDINCLKQPTQ
jgi:hypothetical protein